jgi:hypothetical protein
LNIKTLNANDETERTDEDAQHTIGCVVSKRPVLDHNVVCVAGKNLMFCSDYVQQTQQQVRFVFAGVNPFELDAGIWRLMQTPSTPTKPATPRPTLDYHMVYVPTKNLKVRPFSAHQKGAKRF